MLDHTPRAISGPSTLSVHAFEAVDNAKAQVEGGVREFREFAKTETPLEKTASDQHVGEKGSLGSFFPTPRVRVCARADALARDSSERYGNTPLTPHPPPEGPTGEPRDDPSAGSRFEVFQRPTTPRPRPPIEPGRGWRGPDVCRLVGITYRQLDYWARTELVVPSIAAARGSGTVETAGEGPSELGASASSNAARGSSWRRSEGWRSPDACRVSGVTFRQLDYWARTGLVRPSIAEARGSGTVRRYSFDDLVLLAVVRQLLDEGVSVQAVRGSVDILRTNVAAGVIGSLVFGAGGVRVVASFDELVAAIRAARGLVSVVRLEPVAEDVAGRLAELDRLRRVGVPAIALADELDAGTGTARGVESQHPHGSIEPKGGDAW